MIAMPTKPAAVIAGTTIKDLPPYLTVPQVAALAHRSPNAIRHLHHRGKGPGFALVDGRLLARRADVERWLEGKPRSRRAA
jgi:hypothetical protein